MKNIALANWAVAAVIALPAVSLGQGGPQASLGPSTPAQASAANATVSGSVLDARHGGALRAAKVYLRPVTSKSGGAYLALSDSEGQFILDRITPGQYTVVAARDGYLTTEFGADRTTAAQVITLQAGQNLSDITIRLRSPGVITGRVVDENNDSVPLASVQCLRISYSSGHRKLAMTYGTATNDLGEYRIFGIVPGRYIVMTIYHGAPSVVRGGVILSKSAREAALEGYLPAYYGNATSAETATPVDVIAGTEARGIDLHLTRARVAHVRGLITSSSSGKLVLGGTVRMWRVDTSGRSSGGPETGRIAQNSGAFEYADVPPGTYLIGANGAASGGDREEAWKTIQVGDTDIELNLTLGKPLEVKGSVSVEGATATNYKVTLESTRLSGKQSVDVRSGELFGFKNLPPDAYGVSVASDQDDLYVKAVRLGSTDFTDANVEISQGAGGELSIKMAAGAGEVDGIAEGQDHAPAASVTVVLVPNAPRRELNRLYKFAVTDDKGTFTFKGVAPGGYRVFAWEEVANQAWQGAEFLRPIESLGQEVAVEENAKKIVIVSVIPKATSN